MKQNERIDRSKKVKVEHGESHVGQFLHETMPELQNVQRTYVNRSFRQSEKVEKAQNVCQDDGKHGRKRHQVKYFVDTGRFRVVRWHPSPYNEVENIINYF